MTALWYLYVSSSAVARSPRAKVSWQPRMTYASSKEALKNALNGIAAEVQANRDDEIEYTTILKDLTKGKR